MTDDRKSLGRRGETVAISYLKKQHIKILETNFRTKFSEIDIIAKEGDTLCFIEVKTRRSLKKGLPRESVTPSKQKKIILGATQYLKDNNMLNHRVRFDVVEVVQENGTLSINFIKHAFQTV